MGKTLGEIIGICRAGETPDINDARMAICAMDALMIFDGLHLSRMVQREAEGKIASWFTAEHHYEERFNRVKKAMDKPPVEWLGDDNNPDNPDVQKRRKCATKVMKALVKHKL